MLTHHLHRSLTPVIAAFAIVGAIGLATPAPASAGAVDSAVQGPPGHAYRFVAAPIRNSGSGWELIQDSVHKPVGISSIVTTDARIIVKYDFKPEHVVSFVVSPDETLAGAGILSGASVSLDSASIEIANAKGFVDPKKITTKQYPWGNLWIYGVFEVAP